MYPKITKKAPYYFLFLLSPILSLLTSLRNRENGAYKNILWFFVAFYAFTITFPKSESDYDGIRRMKYFEYTAAKSNYTFEAFERNFDSDDNTQVDFFEPLMVYLLSRVVDDARMLMLVYGLLFGYFYSRNLSYLLDKVGRIRHKSIFFLIVTFAFLNPFWNIGGFRYWFATQLFVYGLLPYLYENNRKKLIWLLLAPFVHFSYVFAIVIFAGYYFFGNRLKIYFYYFIACLFIGNIEIKTFRTLLSFIPGTKIQMKGDSYTDDQYVEKVNVLKQMAVNWYVSFNNTYLYWFVIITIVFCFYKFRAQIEAKYANLFSFILLYLGTTFLVASVPSMPRFNIVGYILVFFFLIVLATDGQPKKSLQRYLGWTKWGLIICIVVSLRLAFDTVSFFSLVSNPLVAPFYSTGNFSMIDLFK